MKKQPTQENKEHLPSLKYHYNSNLPRFQKSLALLSAYGIDIEKTKEKLTILMHQHGNIAMFLDGQGVYGLTKKMRNDIGMYLKTCAFEYKLFKFSKVPGNKNKKDIDVRLTFALDHTNKTIVFLDIYQKKDEHSDCNEDNLIASLKEYETALSLTKDAVPEQKSAQNAIETVEDQTKEFIVYLLEENRGLTKEKDDLLEQLLEREEQERTTIKMLSDEYTTELTSQKEITSRLEEIVLLAEQQIKSLQETQSELIKKITASQLELPFENREQVAPGQFEIDFTIPQNTTIDLPKQQPPEQQPSENPFPELSKFFSTLFRAVDPSVPKHIQRANQKKINRLFK